jgi:hypothetical protein
LNIAFQLFNKPHRVFLSSFLAMASPGQGLNFDQAFEVAFDQAVASDVPPQALDADPELHALLETHPCQQGPRQQGDEEGEGDKEERRGEEEIPAGDSCEEDPCSSLFRSEKEHSGAETEVVAEEKPAHHREIRRILEMEEPELQQEVDDLQKAEELQKAGEAEDLAKWLLSELSGEEEHSDAETEVVEEDHIRAQMQLRQLQVEDQTREEQQVEDQIREEQQVEDQDQAAPKKRRTDDAGDSPSAF